MFSNKETKGTKNSSGFNQLTLAEAQQQTKEACLEKNSSINEEQIANEAQYIQLVATSIIKDIEGGSAASFYFASFEGNKASGKLVYDDSSYGSYNVSFLKTAEQSTVDGAMSTGGWEIASAKACQ